MSTTAVRAGAVALSALAITTTSAGTAGAAIPAGTVEHTVRVMTSERSGRHVERVRQESWIAADRSRLVATTADGALLGETVYAPDATWIFRPGAGLTRAAAVVGPGAPAPGVQPLDAASSAQCALGHPGTRRVRRTRRLGRAVDVFRFTWRSARGSRRETTTCLVDVRTRALLESRTEIETGARAGRGPARTAVHTMRVVSTELVPRRPGMLELSPQAAALAGEAQPLPPPGR